MAAEDFERSRRADRPNGKHPGRYMGGKDVSDSLHRLLHRVGVPEDTRHEVVAQVRKYLKRKQAEADELLQRRRAVHGALKDAGFDTSEVD